MAQFQGKISYQTTDSKGGNESVDIVLDEFNIRILASKAPKSGFESLGLGGNDAIIRFKTKEIVILQENKTALVLQMDTFKALLDGMASMTGQTIPTTFTPPKVTLKRTGKTSSVVGFKVEQIIVTDASTPNEELHLWVNSTLKYRWQNFNDLMASSGLGQEVDFVYYMGDDYLPLKVEQFKDGKLTSSVVATSVSDRKIGPQNFAVPAGYKQMGFQEYFQQMLMRSMMGDGK